MVLAECFCLIKCCGYILSGDFESHTTECTNITKFSKKKRLMIHCVTNILWTRHSITKLDMILNHGPCSPQYATIDLQHQHHQTFPNHHHHHLYVLCMGCNKAYHLNSDDHPLGSTINIAIGKITSPEGNVNEALQTGKDQMRTFQTRWPETFYSKMSRVMKTHH